MPLEVYKSKRDFAATREPKGSVSAKGGNSFVIQKHDARRLHYDLRLEMNGVLVSWAVTKGPSLVPGEKRLAVHVEDHPLDYASFEGTIPKGEYGGGTVIVWDRGTWEPVGDAKKGMAKGHLEFILRGEKLAGAWHLVRMSGNPREKRENWLLIKVEDEESRAESDADILEEQPDSVVTGRSISDVESEAPGWSSKTGRIARKAAPKTGKAKETVAKAAPKAKKAAVEEVADTPALDASGLTGARKGKLPDFLEPMLAKLTAKPPVGDDWLHEIKFDGYRLQARVEAGRVKLLTRSGLDWTKKFGKTVTGALASLPIGTALLDGELVVEKDNGASDFSALQSDLSDGRDDRFVFYLFDVMHLDGVDLTRSPLVERKALLEKLLADADACLRYSGHFGEEGGLVLRHACRLSLEGVVSKKADAPYRSGRGASWVKSKCSARQEFVIGGYVPSSTSRKAIGSLVMGVHEEGELRHVGRVGTGYSFKVAEDLFAKLEKLKQDKSPFADKLTSDEARQVRYVQPKLVAEVEFRAWTGDGHLRHASFRGLREDKPAEEIVRETPKGSATPKVPVRGVKLTHPDRVYWPDAGVTKEGLADYYTQVWKHMAPYIVGRPLALLRAPSGIEGQTFFQKHAWKGLSPKIKLIRDKTDDASEPPLISIDDLDGLIGLVQAAVLEIHPWGSTVAKMEQADMMIMDLDPGEGVTWERVIEAAQEVKQRLEDKGLAAFVKTSGGKGLHVVTPLVQKATWPTVKTFAKAFADDMAGDDPARFVSTITKSKRKGKILVDYLRNQRGMTAVAAYSTRARPGAAVSAPLSWNELEPGIGPDYFTVENMPTRLANLKGDPWDGFFKAAKALPAVRKRK